MVSLSKAKIRPTICNDLEMARALVALPMVRYEALILASMFNIDLYGNCSAVSIKSAIWCSFISRIVF